jgi:hypothetical protein
LRERPAGGPLDVEVQRIGRKPLNRARRGPAVDRQRARNHLRPPAARQRDHRDLVGLDVAVAGRLHLLSRRQVDPELKAAHAAALLLRHLRVDDAAPGGHPLHTARAQLAGVAQMILMLHVTVEHVGHRLEPAMGMRGKTGDVIVGILRGELVEHEEWVEARAVRPAEAAAQLDAGAVRRRNRLDDLPHCTCGHWSAPGKNRLH